MKSLLTIAAISAGLIMASASFADDTTPPPASTTPQHHHHGMGGPLGKAIHQAMASCKSAGVEFKTCAQQLTTYLADFKPNK